MASLEDLAPEVRDELAKLARDLSQNPKTRKDFLKLTKQARPELPVPEIDLDEKTDKALGEANVKIESLERKLMEKEAQENLDKRRQKLIQDGKADSLEQVGEIEKVMLEKKIADHDTAADYWSWMRQAAKPSSPQYSPQVLDADTRKSLSPYWKNPQMAARSEAAQALDDLRKGKVRLGRVN